MVKLSLKGFGHIVKIDRLRAHSLTLIFRHSALKNVGSCWFKPYSFENPWNLLMTLWNLLETLLKYNWKNFKPPLKHIWDTMISSIHKAVPQQALAVPGWLSWSVPLCSNCTALCWRERAAFQRSGFGRSTAGNDVVATIFICLFFFSPVFSPVSSVATFSHRRSARIKKLI